MQHPKQCEAIVSQYKAGTLSYDLAMDTLTKVHRLSERRADDLLHPPAPLPAFDGSSIKPKAAITQLVPQGKPVTVPAHAVAVWVESDTLFVHLPGTESEGHVVHIPLDKMIPDTGLTGLPKAHQRGFAVLIDTLHARANANANQRAIGFQGNMPKDAIEKALESDEKYQAWIAAGGHGTRTLLKRKSAGERLLDELGL